jgi:hypothetical protein
MECHGMPWNAMECHGMPWNAMECHGMPWNAMECHGLPAVTASIQLNLPQMLYCWSILLGICSCFAEKQYHYSKWMLYNDIALLEFYVIDFLCM